MVRGSSPTTQTKALPVNHRFIELPMASSPNQETEAAVLELRDSNGRTMKIRISPVALSQLPTLATTLWGLS